MRDEVSEGICDCVTVDVSISYEPTSSTKFDARSPAPPNEAMVGPSPDDLSTDSIELKANGPKRHLIQEYNPK